jgi:hypothetical protein
MACGCINCIDFEIVEKSKVSSTEIQEIDGDRTDELCTCSLTSGVPYV